jgi:hypothetical protein
VGAIIVEPYFPEAWKARPGHPTGTRRGGDGQSIVTFETPDNFRASFALPNRDLANMAMTAARRETDLQPPVGTLID